MTSTDGRVARRHKNRTAVLDAVIELFEAGDLDPSVEQVAERSGVSTRSVYRHFHHREQLMRESIQHLMARIEPQMKLDDLGVGSLAERIEHFSQHRVRMYLTLAPLTRAAIRAAQVESIVRREFDIGRQFLAQQFLEQFAPELDRLHEPERTRVATVGQLPFQFQAFEYLHEACGGDTDEMMILLTQLLWQNFSR